MSSDFLVLRLSSFCDLKASPSNNIAEVLLLCSLISSRVKAGPTVLESGLLDLEKMTSRCELDTTLVSLGRLLSEWFLRSVVRPASSLSYNFCDMVQMVDVFLVETSPKTDGEMIRKIQRWYGTGTSGFCTSGPYLFWKCDSFLQALGAEHILVTKSWVVFYDYCQMTVARELISWKRSFNNSYWLPKPWKLIFSMQVVKFQSKNHNFSISRFYYKSKLFSGHELASWLRS